MNNLSRNKSSELETGGAALGRIHAKANSRKATAYWLGFLKGILASEEVEKAEFNPIRVEAENFLSLLGDPDARELIEDLSIWKDDPGEVHGIIQNIIDIRSQEFLIETEKDEINEFYGFCAGIACDRRLTPAEVEKLLKRLDSYPRIHNDSRIKNLKSSAIRAISDGRITADESDEIYDWITRLVGDSASDTGLPTFGNVGVIENALRDHRKITFDGGIFVLTGTFTLGPRKVISEMIAERGGLTKKYICKNTNYLAVALESSRDWRHSHEGLKIMRAMELRDTGIGPAIVQENTLEQALLCQNET